MKKTSVFIVEDEKDISESLAEIVACLGYQLAGTAPNGSLALSRIEDSRPDIILLDIQLEGNINGLELSRLFKDRFDIPFVFTTAFADSDTIMKARKEGPYGYVVKPYGIKDIHAAIEMAIGKHEDLSKAANKHENAINNKIFLKVNSRFVQVDLNDVLYIECKGDYAVFKTQDHGYIVHGTMKSFLDRLVHTNFLKVHRSYIINLDKIVDIEDSNLLIADKLIPISRSNKEALMNSIQTI